MTADRRAALDAKNARAVLMGGDDVPPRRPARDRASRSPDRVGERDLDLVGRFDHMIVRQYVAIGADDHARAEALLLHLARQLRQQLAEELVEWVAFAERRA